MKGNEILKYADIENLENGTSRDMKNMVNLKH